MGSKLNFLRSGQLVIAYLLALVVITLLGLGETVLLNVIGQYIVPLLLFSSLDVGLWVGFFVLLRSIQRRGGVDAYTWKPGVAFWIAVVLLAAYIVVSMLLRIPTAAYGASETRLMYLRNTFTLDTAATFPLLLATALLLTARSHEQGRSLLPLLVGVGALSAALFTVTSLISWLASSQPFAFGEFALATLSRFALSIALFLAAALVLRLVRGRLLDALTLFSALVILLRTAGMLVGRLFPADWAAGIAHDLGGCIVYLAALAGLAALLRALEKGTLDASPANWIRKLRTFGTERDRTTAHRQRLHTAITPTEASVIE